MLRFFLQKIAFGQRLHYQRPCPDSGVFKLVHWLGFAVFECLVEDELEFAGGFFGVLAFEFANLAHLLA